jgi:hypothetical protein
MLFTSYPQDIPLSLRIAILSSQVRILALLGKNVDSYIADLEVIIQQIEALDLRTAVGALLLVGPFNPAAAPVTAACKTLQVCRLYSRLPVEEQSLRPDIPLASLIWTRLIAIQKQEDIRGILRVLADMTEEERRAAFSYDPLHDIRQLFVDDCWMIESLKSEDEQDWKEVLALIDDILQIAHLPGGDPLLEPAMRAKAIVLADYMERPQKALALLDGTPPSADNNARFLIHYTAACILLEPVLP